MTHSSPGKLRFLCWVVALAFLLPGCDRAAAPHQPGLAALRQQFMAAVALRDVPSRLSRLRDLDGRLEGQLESSRGARNLSLGICLAISEALALTDQAQEARDWRERVDARSREYHRLDPQDGKLMGFMIQRLIARDQLKEARRLLAGAGERIDLDTAESLLDQASSLDHIRHLGRDPRGEGARAFEAFCGALEGRLKTGAGRDDLLEHVMFARGMTLLGMGRVALARKQEQALATLGLKGSYYFRLQTALLDVPSR